MAPKSAKRAARENALVIVQNNASGSVSYWERGTNQSASDRNGVSLADYIHAMYGFLRQAKSQHVLMIGCGGGTLATMLHRSDVRVTVVDLSAASFDIARRYFHMPDAVECHIAEGEAFLRRARERYDAIVLDAYADEEIPDHFLKPSFFKLVKSRLTPRNAIFLMNILVADDDDRTPDGVARLVGKTWRRVRLLDSDGWVDRNAVVAAGAVHKLKRSRLLMPPARGAKTLAIELKAMAFRRLRA